MPDLSTDARILGREDSILSASDGKLGSMAEATLHDFLNKLLPRQMNQLAKGTELSPQLAGYATRDGASQALNPVRQRAKQMIREGREWLKEEFAKQDKARGKKEEPVKQAPAPVYRRPYIGDDASNLRYLKGEESWVDSVNGNVEGDIDYIAPKRGR